MRTILIIAVFSWLLLPVYSGVAGELYELDEYLSAINVENPYEDGGGGTPVSAGSPFTDPSPNPVNPVFDTDGGGGQGDGGTGGNGFSTSSGQGNYNQLPNSNETSSFAESGSQNQRNTGFRDYLTQAVMTTAGNRTSGKRKGKYEKETTILFLPNGIILQTVPSLPYRVRAVRDKQIAYQKIQRAVKTPFERCYQTTVIPVDCLCSRVSAAVSVSPFDIIMFNLGV